MNALVTRAGEMEWQPLIEAGVDTRGLWVKPLRTAPAGRPISFLLRFEAGASYPNHNHPAGEDLFVVEGEVRVGSLDLREGDFLYTPPDHAHAVTSAQGCVVLFTVPEEVEIL